MVKFVFADKTTDEQFKIASDYIKLSKATSESLIAHEEFTAVLETIDPDSRVIYAGAEKKAWEHAIDQHAREIVAKEREGRQLRSAKKNWTEDVFKSLAPPGPKGTRITNDIPKQCFEGYYPDAKPRGSCSRSYTCRSELTALRLVVDWLWSKHQEACTVSGKPYNDDDIQQCSQRFF